MVGNFINTLTNSADFGNNDNCWRIPGLGDEGSSGGGGGGAYDELGGSKGTGAPGVIVVTYTDPDLTPVKIRGGVKFRFDEILWQMLWKEPEDEK